jgi:hypothetical protein
MDSFQAITIGYGLASRIEGNLATLMKTLNDPPNRSERFLPGGSTIRIQEGSNPVDVFATLPGNSDASTETRTETRETEAEVPYGATTALPGSKETVLPVEPLTSIQKGIDPTRNISSEPKADMPPQTGNQADTISNTWSRVAESSGIPAYLFIVLALGVILSGAILLLQRRKQKHRPVSLAKNKDKDDPPDIKDGEL